MDADEATYKLFDEWELQGGYTWEGIVTALIEMHRPAVLPQLEIGAEADNMYIYCADRKILEEIAVLIRAAIADQNLLIKAMKHAGEDLE